MPPPPATPSPHRFVIKKQAPPRNTSLTQEHTPRPSTQQFNTTPRFNFSSTPRAIPRASATQQGFQGPAPSASRYLTPGNRISRDLDVIDTSSDDFLEDVQESIEIDEGGIDRDLQYGSAEEESHDIDSRTPKRRRLSKSLNNFENEDDEELPQLPNPADLTELPSSPLPILSSPPAPKYRLSTAAPRFLLSTPAPPSTPHAPSQQPSFLKPPRFRPPDPSEQTQARTEPLPDQFSPHRRGQKYLPGGLAAEVRDWLVNIESSVPAKATTGGNNEDDPWGLKIVVDEVKGGRNAGFTLVSGRQVLEDGLKMIDYLGVVRIILAGEGQGVGLQKGRSVEVGSTVGVKGVAWDVVIEGDRWKVGVDWKVL